MFILPSENTVESIETGANKTIGIVACVESIPVQRAFLHSANWSESKNSVKQGVVGRERERLPANLSILQNAHWFSRLSSFIDQQFCHRAKITNMILSVKIWNELSVLSKGC